MEKHKIIVALTGASGAIYAKVLLDKLMKLDNQISEIGLLMSANAKLVWETELGNKDYTKIPFTSYENNNFLAPFASGSANYNTMIICPCSMGTIGRIASGTSDNLTIRAADVILKEKRRLILVAREAPYNLIHINNMKCITEAGGIICPASPSFYSNPQNFEELVGTVIDRVITLSGLTHESFSWGDEQ